MVAFLFCDLITPLLGTWLGRRLKVSRLYSLLCKVAVSTSLENQLEIRMKQECELRVLFCPCFNTVKRVIIYAFGELRLHGLWVWKFSLRVESPQK